MAVTSSGRAKVTNLVQPDHATAFPSGRENPVQAHRQRGAETSGYREAILTCPDLQSPCPIRKRWWVHSKNSQCPATINAVIPG
jgi:hypothetical protein